MAVVVPRHPSHQEDDPHYYQDQDRQHDHSHDRAAGIAPAVSPTPHHVGPLLRLAPSSAQYILSARYSQSRIACNSFAAAVS
jgi:hypothetical protein